MNVASLEPCKELYELSGWEFDQDHRRIEKVWIESFSTSEMGQGHEDYDKTPVAERRQYHVGDFVVRDNPKNFIGIPEDVPWGWANRYYMETVKRSVPAYNLGYLLRKLPESIDPDSERNRHLHLEKGFRWTTYYYDVVSKEKYYPTFDGTPEDALCRLAIKLFQDGILTQANPNKERE